MTKEKLDCYTVKPFELREQFYNNFLCKYNVDMPVGHLLPIIQEMCCNSTEWRGFRANTNPCDIWMYQEIIHETKPNVIIEIGNEKGGTAVFFRDMLHLNGGGWVLGIDTDHKQLQKGINDVSHILWVEGDAKSEEVLGLTKSLLDTVKAKRVMVVDDSLHTRDHTLAVLNLYSPLVTRGCYFVVEDTILNQGIMRKDKDSADSSSEAVDIFLKENDSFEANRWAEKFFITNCPNGFLKRVK